MHLIVEVYYFLLVFLKALEGKLNSKLLSRQVVSYIILWIPSLPILAFNITKTLSNYKAILITTSGKNLPASDFTFLPF